MGRTGVELLLIRHGQTDSNVAGALDTAEPGADLTPLGERQARELADHLAGTRIDAVFCSPRLRARRTAEPLLALTGLVPAYREGVAEMSAGDWEMSVAEEHRREYAAIVRAWMGGDVGRAVPGGEPMTAILARFDEVVAEAAALGAERVAIVAHGGIIRLWSAARATGLPDLDTIASSLRNTGIVRLRDEGPGRERRWRVLEWDEREISLG